MLAGQTGFLGAETHCVFTHMRRACLGPWFARRSQTCLLCQDGSSLPPATLTPLLGSSWGGSAERGSFATRPLLPQERAGLQVPGHTVSPASCFPPTSLAQLRLKQSS